MRLSAFATEHESVFCIFLYYTSADIAPGSLQKGGEGETIGHEL
jgi:hypothetical protein